MPEVNAVNGADAAAKAQEAQASQKRNYTPVIAGTVVGGAAGAGAAALWGKTAPSLEEVFAQKPDVFKKSVEAMKGENGASGEKIEKAMKEINDAAAPKKAELKAEAIKLRDGELKTAYDTEAAKPDSDLAKAKKELDDAKTALNNKEIEIKTKEGDKEVVNKKTVTKIREEYVAAQKDLKAKEKAVADAGKDATDAQKTAVTDAKTKLTESKKEYDMIASQAKDDRAKVVAADKKFHDARKAIKNGAKEDSDLGKAIKEVNKKAEAVKTAVKEKTTEVVSRDEIKNAYKDVKGALKEISWKNMSIWGGIAAVVGLVAGMVLGKNNEA
ncbi:hypothetical protein J6E39_06240 [bacterium]|nr:hypothetical protein [bacterium]